MAPGAIQGFFNGGTKNGSLQKNLVLYTGPGGRERCRNYSNFRRAAIPGYNMLNAAAPGSLPGGFFYAAIRLFDPDRNAAQAGSSAAGAIEKPPRRRLFLFSEALSARVRRFYVSVVFTYSESLKPRYRRSTASSAIIRHTGNAERLRRSQEGRGRRDTGGRVPEGPRIFWSGFSGFYLAFFRTFDFGRI